MINFQIRRFLTLLIFSFIVIYSNAQSLAGNSKKKSDSVYASTYYFYSDADFNLALKSRKLTAYYSIVTIKDSLSDITRKRCGVLFKNTIIIPFEYDSIAHTIDREFICRKQQATRRTHTSVYTIIDAMKGSLLDIKASSITYITNHTYSITANHRQYFLNTTTRKQSVAFDKYSVFDSSFLMINSVEEYRLYDDSVNLFIPDVFKSLVKQDTIYQTLLYPTWNIYQNSGTLLFSKLNADSIEIDSAYQTWRLYRNDKLFYRRNVYSYVNTTSSYLAVDNKVAVNDTAIYRKLKEALLLDTIYFTSDGLFLYKKNKQYGYCDSVGNIKIAHQYDTLSTWSDGMALIRFKGKWGYINKREKMCVQPYYIIAYPFYEGSAAVYDGKRWSFVNKEGKPVNSLDFDSIQQTVAGRWYVYSKGKMGLCETNGKELLPPTFDAIYDSGSNLIVYKAENRYGLILKDRTVVCKPIYDDFVIDRKNNCYILKNLPENPLTIPIKRN